jgi:hypothetical protein
MVGILDEKSTGKVKPPRPSRPDITGLLVPVGIGTAVSNNGVVAPPLSTAKSGLTIMVITQYWIDAVPFASEEEALAAIADFDLYHPHDLCIIHRFSRDGIFVRAFDYDAGSSGWLTTDVRDEQTITNWYLARFRAP